MRSYIPQSLLGAGSLLLSACGGGFIDGVFASPEIVHLPNVPTESGFTYAAGPLHGSDGALMIRVGDSTGDDERRGFLRFDLSALPAGAEIVEARVHIGQENVVGAPFTTMGAVIVDHVNMGAGFSIADFGAVPLTFGIGVLSSSSTLGARVVDVTDAVEADIAAGRTRSDFRLRFGVGTDADGVQDYVDFNDADDQGGSGLIPYLRVEYFP